MCFRNVGNYLPADRRNFPEYLNLLHSRGNLKSHTHFQNYILDLPYVFLVCCDYSLIKIVNFGYMEGNKEERKQKERKNKEGEKKGVPCEFYVPDGHLNSRIQGPLTCANFCNFCSYCRPRIWHDAEGEEFWRKQTNSTSEFDRSESFYEESR